MTVTRLVLLGLALSSMKTSLSLYLTKCCSPGEIFSGHSEVKCTSVLSNATELHVLHGSAAAEFHGLPRCDKSENIVTTPLADLLPNRISRVLSVCLEILREPITGESNVIGVYCRANKQTASGSPPIRTSPIPQLTYVRKCCPRGTIFDWRTKACVPRTNDSNSLVKFLPSGPTGADHALVVTKGPPRCDGPIVNYVVHQRDILRNGTYYSVTVPAFEDSLIAKEEFLVTAGSACLETTPNSMFDRRLVARVCRDPRFCERRSCVRKCCAEDEFLSFPEGCEGRVRAASRESTSFHQALASAVNGTRSSTFDTTKDYGLLVGKLCEHGVYSVDPREEEWSLTSEGRIIDESSLVYDRDEYCMDILYNDSRNNKGFRFFICFDEPTAEDYSPLRHQVNIALEFTSCVFLLITLLVYACLPSLQNLHGKTLMCHVGSLFVAFGCLAVSPWIQPFSTFNEDPVPKVTMMCKALAYIMLFSFLSAFSWLNVMCFDIWWTFGNFRGSRITRRHRKRFLLYCLYAWGFPFLVSILAIGADTTDILPAYLQPKIGCTSCWFTQNPGSYGEVTFFIGPVTIQLISNVVFFVLTSMYCNRVKAEIKRVTSDPADLKSRRFRSDRSRFVMNIKLFVVMGISWICEVVSFFLKKYFYYIYWQHTLFYASDVFNCLQGLLIFVLFVLKNRVYLALRSRLGLSTKTKKKPASNNAAATLQDPHRVRKRPSTSTLTSTFAIISTP